MILYLMPCDSLGQRRMENLDRGLQAVKVNNGVYVNWRIKGTEWYNVSYNLYRNGTLLNPSPITGASNYVDTGGTLSSNYQVSAIVNGVEQPKSNVASVLANPWIDINLRTIPKIAGVPDKYYDEYSINDITAADLDGDGEYELIIKRRNEGYDSENPFENKYYTLFEAYKMDGTHMWTIDIGPNMIHNVEVNVLAYDFDGDGKAEVVLRSSEGTVDGVGNVIGDVADESGNPTPDGKTNYRDGFELNNSWFESKGPEFLSLYDGVTGKELDRIDHIQREPFSQWGTAGMKPAQLAHRATKFHYGAPYLDGKKPSVFVSRGIYHRIKMKAFDVVGKKFVEKWDFDSESGPYSGQGNHNFSIADVDNDGCDEIVYGSMVVDNDGKGLYTTELGHGDAIHVGNFDPYRKGIEVFACLENSPNWGASLRAAETGAELWHHDSGRDMGRCMAANISNQYKGFEVWDNDVMHSASERKDISLARGSTIFRIFWDGDLLHELVGHDWIDAPRKGVGNISKFDDNSSTWSNILTADGFYSSNDTKGTPSLQADLFGDWREEIIWRSDDDQSIRIFMTDIPTEHRIYTLMHDMQYRQAIAWQMCGYNQPPHVSFFVGERENILVPPPPVMDNERLVFLAQSSGWDNSSMDWSEDGTTTTYSDGKDVLFDVLSMDKSPITLNGTLKPNNLFVNSIGVHTLDGTSGKLSGDMMLLKQGSGTLNVTGTHDYSGRTEIWDGLVNLDGQLQNSLVYLHLFGELSAKGNIDKGVEMRYGSILYPGMKDAIGSVNIGDSLSLQENANFILDIGTVTSDFDKIKIDGDFNFYDGFTILINKIGGTVSTGDYEIIEVTGDINGDISKVILDESFIDYPLEIRIEGKKIILTIEDVRPANSITWLGDKNSALWDLAKTKNFNLNNEDVFFVSQDNILFDDSSENRTITLKGVLPASQITVNTNDAYTFTGDGKITSDASILKKGTGKLTINTTNEYRGTTVVEGGTLEVSSLPSNTNPSSIGYADNTIDAFVINGGTLTSSGDALETTQNLTIGEGGAIFDNTADFVWNAEIKGGILTKKGTSGLNLYVANTHKKTIIKEGAVTFKSDAATPGDTVVLDGGILYTLDNANSYNSAYWNIDVPKESDGQLYLDGRCDYYGSLVGGGNLDIYVSFVRSILRGDWSAFSGTITAGTYGRASYAKDLYFDNSYGLPNAELVVTGSFGGMYNAKNTLFQLGALKGGAGVSMNGNHPWEIGNKNIDSYFDGTITAGSIIKIGDAKLTLSSANTYTGGTTVNGGTLVVTNTSGSATGTGALEINKGAALGGTGIVGSITTIKDSAMIILADSVINQLTFDNTLVMSSKSKTVLDVSTTTTTADVIKGNNTITLGGALEFSPLEENPAFAKDMSFPILQSDVALNITGQFDTIMPALSGGLYWDQTDINSGIIKIGYESAELKQLLINDQVWDITNKYVVPESYTGSTITVKIASEDNAATISPNNTITVDVSQPVTKNVEFTITTPHGWSKKYTLVVEKPDLGPETTTIKINGADWDKTSKYVVPCGYTSNTISIEIDPARKGTVSPSGTINVDVSKADIQTIPITITGTVNESYSLIVEKRFDFNTLVSTKWNNVLTVNNNPATNGNYTFKAYKWFKNNQEIGNGKQYYSAGGKKTDLLDSQAEYSVQVTTSDDKVLSTCPGTVTLKSMSMSAYPNPANAGQMISVELDMDEELLEKAELTIYNLSGSSIERIKVVGASNSIKAPTSGMYVLRLTTSAGITKELKFVVK